MPLYEYKCEGCGDVFEVIQKFSDQPLTVHDKCGGKVDRLISVSALQFKGAGWYVNDYGKGHNKEAKQEAKQKSDAANGSGKSEKSNGSSSASDSSGKSDSSSKSETSSKTDSSSSTTSTPSVSKSDNKK